MENQVFAFDWKEDPGAVIDQLTPYLKQLGVVVTVIETGSDAYVFNLGPRKLTKKEQKEVLHED